MKMDGVESGTNQEIVAKTEPSLKRLSQNLVRQNPLEVNSANRKTQKQKAHKRILALVNNINHLYYIMLSSET